MHLIQIKPPNKRFLKIKLKNPLIYEVFYVGINQNGTLILTNGNLTYHFWDV